MQYFSSKPTDPFNAKLPGQLKGSKKKKPDKNLQRNIMIETAVQLRFKVQKEQLLTLILRQISTEAMPWKWNRNNNNEMLKEPILPVEEEKVVLFRKLSRKEVLLPGRSNRSKKKKVL